MACEDARELLGGYLDDELDMATSLEFRRHLRECPSAQHNSNGKRHCGAYCGLRI